MIGSNGITDGEQIETIGKKLFGKKFKGVFLVKTKSEAPSLKEKEVAILNTGSLHWYAIWKKNGKLYESDSFNIERLGLKYQDAKVESCFVQKLKDTNCGQRSLSNAWYALKK